MGWKKYSRKQTRRLKKKATKFTKKTQGKVLADQSRKAMNEMERHDRLQLDMAKNSISPGTTITEEAVDKLSEKFTPDMPDINIPDAPVYSEAPTNMSDSMMNRMKKRKSKGRQSTILTGSLGSSSGSFGKTLLGS